MSVAFRRYPVFYYVAFLWLTFLATVLYAIVWTTKNKQHVFQITKTLSGEWHDYDYKENTSLDAADLLCKVPKLSLNDDRFSEDFKVLPKLVCSGQSLFRIKDCTLRLNTTVLGNRSLEYCVYAAVERLNHWKAAYSTSIKRYGNFDGKVDAEVFRVQCFVSKDKANKYKNAKEQRIAKKDDEDIIQLKPAKEDYKWNGVKPDFDQIFAQIIPTRDLLERCSRTKPFVNSTQMNVLIYGIDSMSHVSWTKILPKSYTYLKNTLKSVILDGYNILGDATAAALIPMLTGRKEIELPEIRRNKPGTNHVDVYPLIWKEFVNSSYVTLLAEDTPFISLFSWRFTGFDKAPVDHYMRPFWLAGEKSTIWKKSKRYCIGDKPKHQHTFDYIKDLFDKYPRVSKFAFGFHTELSHGSTPPVQHIDQDLRNFLDYLKSAGHLNNTLLIVMADHGARFVRRRKTIEGKLEERLPMMSLTFPEKFKTQHPKLFRNLLKNKLRLTTPFDIYETLQSVLNIYNAEKPVKPSDRGISLLNVIPANRTCKSAGIELHWCTCMQFEPLSVKEEKVQQAAKYAVTYINKLLYVAKDRCHELKLRNVLEARKAYPNEEVIKFVNSRNDNPRTPAFNKKLKLDIIHYQFTIETTPNNALYEVTIKQYVSNRTLSLIGDFSRLNLYGHQADCIMETYPELRKYCLCREATS